MKIHFLSLFFSSFIIMIASASPKDTTIRGVAVRFTYSRSIFPSSWLGKDINAQGEEIDKSEISRSLLIIAKALHKYPQTSLQRDLRSIYFLKSMNFFNVGYGGTNSTDALYLTNNGTANGFSDLYMEQTFHHEYSSILYRNHTSWFDVKGWTEANPPRFLYNDPENGVGAIRNNASSQDLDTALCRRGFLTQYSQSSLENDLNTFAQNLFSPSEGFWELADTYPAISRKMKLMVKFYNRIDTLFTEEYFRKLK